MMSLERRTARIIRNGARVSDIPVLIGAHKKSGKGRGKCAARLIQGEQGKGRIEVKCSCGATILIECEYEKSLRDEDGKD